MPRRSQKQTARKGGISTPGTRTTTPSTGLDSPALFEGGSPAPTKSTTPGTTPGYDEVSAAGRTYRSSKGKGKRALSSESELSDLDDAEPPASKRREWRNLNLVAMRRC